MQTRSVAEGARSVARRLLEARARDIGPGLDYRSCLVVAPHPDDETLGCGATIARKAAAGTPVTVVIVSDGSRSHRSDTISPAELGALRRAEAERAVAALGARVTVEFLDFPDGELAGHQDEIGARLRSFIEDLAPDDIFSPALAEPPSDHSAVAAAVRQACRRGDAGRLLEYPVWMWSQWPWTGDHSIPRLLVDPIKAIAWTPAVKVATGARLDSKSTALRAYQTQTTHFRGDPDWAPLPDALLRRCLGAHEIFFPVGRKGR